MTTTPDNLESTPDHLDEAASLLHSGMPREASAHALTALAYLADESEDHLLRATCALERIADALERIADALERLAPTPKRTLHAPAPGPTS